MYLGENWIPILIGNALITKYFWSGRAIRHTKKVKSFNKNSKYSL